MDSEVDQLLSLAPLDEALADRQQRRAAHRRIFRDMIKGELEAGPLTWLRRRALVKFARSLDIDRPEAELLIRGVEYEGAMIPPVAMPSAQLPLDDHDPAQARAMGAIRLIILLLSIAMSFQLLRLVGLSPF